MEDLPDERDKMSDQVDEAINKPFRETAQAEISFVRRDGRHDFIVRQCQHKFKGEQKNLAHAAYRCYELLKLAKEGDMK